MSQHETTPPEIDELEVYDDRDPQNDRLHPFWIVLILVAVGGVGFMMFDGTESETYFYEVDKAVAKAEKIKGKVIRIKGNVEKGSIVRTKGKLETTFRLTTKGKSILVHYNKAMPDTFEEEREVVAQGKVNDKLEMQADEVVVKCPSRYEEEAPTSGPAKQAKGPLKQQAPTQKVASAQ